MAYDTMTPIRREREQRAAQERGRSGGRQRVRSPYSAMQYYEDAGTTLTPAQHEAWLRGEQNYLEAKEKALTDLEKYKGQVEKGKSEVDAWFQKTGGSSDAWFQKEWDKFKSSDPNMVNVRLVNPKNGIVGSYTVHKNTLDEFNKKAQGLSLDPNIRLKVDPQKEWFGEDVGEALSDFHYRDKSGGYVYIVDPTYVDQEDRERKFNTGLGSTHLLKLQMQGREEGTRTAYEKKVRPELEKAFQEQLPNILKTKSALAEAEQKYNLGKSNVESQIKQKEMSDEDLKKAYQERIANMNKLFGGLKIESR